MTREAGKRGLALTICLFAFFISSARSAPHADDKPDARRAAENVNAFAFDLYALLAKNNPANLFFSPQNISEAFAMLHAGAGGETADELRRVFHYGETAQADMGALRAALNAAGDAAVLEAANAVWPDISLSLKESYRLTLKNNFGAEITQLDYRNDTDKAIQTINDWTQKQTRGKIRDLIARLAANTKLVLTSAVYFKSNWDAEFPKADTRKQPFRKADGTAPEVELMSRSGLIAYCAGDGFQAVRLPYRDGTCAMLVVLPEKQKDGRFAPLDPLASNDVFRRIVEGMQWTEVIVRMPKFRNEARYELSDYLRRAGLARAFSPGAQFDGISDTPLLVDQVAHKTFVDVSETGTEAAAATFVGVRAMAGPPRPKPEPIEFRADHPFLYYIVESSARVILFMGRYAGPEAGK
ncbi:MAG: serpin family protein [Desulfovibrio sp.]|jgi:serpin B|nr:serpin family protein [Desulfovibrio sp.]